MKHIEIEVPESIYLEVFEKFGSRKKVEDILSVRLGTNIRKNRRLVSRPEPERTISISIFIKDHIYPYWNELLLHRSESKQTYITRMLKRLNR
jgi:hypothetical protein